MKTFHISLVLVAVVSLPAALAVTRTQEKLSFWILLIQSAVLGGLVVVVRCAVFSVRFPASPVRQFAFGATLSTVIVCAAFFSVRIWPGIVYSKEREAILHPLKQIRKEGRPVDVDAETWDVATGWAITAHVNVCFSDSHVSLDELRRLRIDAATRLAGEPSLDTIDWFMQRLGETGPHGHDYIDRFGPLYREHVDAALARAAGTARPAYGATKTVEPTGNSSSP